MPIIYSALVPHSPLLIPTIGKDARNKLSKTCEAFEQVKEKAKEYTIETMLVFSVSDDHTKHKNMHRLCVPTAYAIEFSTFGDLLTEKNYPCDAVLGLEIKNDLTSATHSLSYKSEGRLDYTAGVPLLLLNDVATKALVIQPAETDTQSLYAFGQQLSRTLQRSSKRIMCIASGDFARCVEKKDHEHYAEQCMPFDFMLLDAIQKKQPESLLAFDPRQTETMGACILPVAIVLRGILDSMEWTSTLLSYEAPFGVGYGVIEFIV